VIAEQPTDKEIHVILDNYSLHKKNSDWLAKYEGRVQFHFTPTSASWLEPASYENLNGEAHLDSAG
jgi:hypothetical protein